MLILLQLKVLLFFHDRLWGFGRYNILQQTFFLCIQHYSDFKKVMPLDPLTQQLYRSLPGAKKNLLPRINLIYHVVSGHGFQRLGCPGLFQRNRRNIRLNKLNLNLLTVKEAWCDNSNDAMCQCNGGVAHFHQQCTRGGKTRALKLIKPPYLPSPLSETREPFELTIAA